VKQGLKKVHADIFLFHAKSIGAYLHIIRANYYGADNKVKDTIHHFILQKTRESIPLKTSTSATQKNLSQRIDSPEKVSLQGIKKKLHACQLVCT